MAEVLSWSFGCAASGTWPQRGLDGEALFGERAASAGKPLARNWRACYFGFKYDAKARKEANFFERSYYHNQICEACFAERPNKYGDPLLEYKDFYPGAAHLMTGLNHADYVRSMQQISPWAIMPGFHVWTCFRDPMHTIFLGTAKSLIASLIGLWIRRGCLGDASLAEQLRKISEEQTTHCKNAGVRAYFSTYTPANTGLDTPSEFPELGSRFKAASIKASLWYFSEKAVAVAEACARGNEPWPYTVQCFLHVYLSIGGTRLLCLDFLFAGCFPP